MAPALFFYLFSTVMLVSAAMVVVSRNPVHSVLYLILAFVNASALFMLTGAEFLAMLLIVVYVGAVAVLFLFVVMMLDVDFAALKQGFLQALPIGAVIGVIVAIELLVVFTGWRAAPETATLVGSPTPPEVSNTVALGRVIYTKYVFFFEAAGMVLLTAMIGAIVLTVRHRKDVRRQNIADQNARTAKSAVEMKKVASRAGV